MKNQAKKLNRHHFSINQQFHINPKSPTKLYYAPYLKQYKKSFEPDLNMSLKDKIQIQAQAKQKVKERQQQKDLYFKYNYNPFNRVSKQKIIQERRSLMKNNQPIVNIVSLIDPQISHQQQKQKQLLNRDEYLTSLTHSIKQLRSNLLKNRMKLERKQNIDQNNNLSKSQKKHMGSESEQIARLREEIHKEEQYKLFQMQIHQIAAYIQKSHFSNKKIKINIFTLARDQINEVSPLDHLLKHKFCLNGVIDHRYKFRLPTYRDLSNFGRTILKCPLNNKENVLFHLFSEQLILNMNQLNFSDVLSVASNRISSQFLQKKLSNEPLNLNIKQNNYQQSSQASDHRYNIYYKKNQVNRLDNHQEEQQQMQQIKDYQKFQVRKTEKEYYQTYKRDRQKVLKVGQQQKSLVQNTINDEQTHNRLGTKTKQMIEYLLSSYITKDQINSRSQNKSSTKLKRERDSHNISFDRIVRMKKSNPSNVDRLTNVKLNSFREMLKQKNKLSNIRNQMSRKSINKTQKQRNNSTIF